MRFIEPSASVVVESNPLKKIERVGRTCYKSESAITEESAEKFVNGLASRKHFAMLEHAVIHFKYVTRPGTAMSVGEFIHAFADSNEFTKFDEVAKECDNGEWEIIQYLTISFSHLFRPDVEDPMIQKQLRDMVETYLKDGTNIFPGTEGKFYIIADEDLKTELNGWPNLYEKHMFYTFHFVCDRGVSHELVRHRCSFGQESTRYCNYVKDKFGSELSFILPSTFNDWPDTMKELFYRELNVIEQGYIDMIKAGLQPQQARAILPNALKTEVMMTAPIKQWIHFTNLRSKGTTGAPHPDMKVVADIVLSKLAELEPEHFTVD